MALDVAAEGEAVLLSVVAPCFNEQDCLYEFYRRTSAARQSIASGDYEIVLVDDGSRDDTWQIIQSLSQADGRVVGVHLMRNHGHQLAASAGLCVSRGNAPLWDFSALAKVYVLLSPIATYALSLDLALAAAVLAPLVWALAIGRLEAHAGLMLSAGSLALLALAAPTAVAGTWWIDNRFPIIAVLALVAGTRPNLPLAANGRALIAAALAGAVLVRTGWITYVWHERQADVVAVRRAVSVVPQGAAILPLDNAISEADMQRAPIGRYFHNGHPTHWSLPVLAIMWRQAFVPNLFWAAGKQPLRVLPPWNQISFPEDGLLLWDALLEADKTPAHFKSWRERYQYVLLVDADVGKGIELSAFPELKLARDEGFARLYAVRAPATKPPSDPQGLRAARLMQ